MARAGQRLPEVDLLRAVALLGVGVIHAGAWVTSAEAPPSENAMATVSGLARFCVPAFVFASGFVLFHSYQERALQAKAFLKRRWLRVLLPWTCCVPLFLALDALQGDPSLQPGAVGTWLAYGPGHLYFLILIAQLYLLFLVLPRNPVRLRWATAGLVLLQVALMAWRTYGALPAGAFAWPGVLASPEEAPFWAGTFALGALTAAEWPRLAPLDRWWPLAVLASAAAAGLLLMEGRIIADTAVREGSGAYLWPSRLPQTIVWSLTLLWLGRRFHARWGIVWPAVGRLSQHSLGIYLLHPMFLAFLGPHTAWLPAAIRVPVLAAVSFVCAYLLVRLLSFSGPTAAAVGEEPRSRPARLTPNRLAPVPLRSRA